MSYFKYDKLKQVSSVLNVTNAGPLSVHTPARVHRAYWCVLPFSDKPVSLSYLHKVRTALDGGRAHQFMLGLLTRKDRDRGRYMVCSTP